MFNISLGRKKVATTVFGLAVPTLSRGSSFISVGSKLAHFLAT